MRRVVQSIGALFAGISLTLLLVSILTTQWVVIRVDRERAPAVTDQTSELSYWSHDRGLYRECWLNQNLNPMIVNSDFYHSDNCLKVDLTVMNPDSLLESTEYQSWSILQLVVIIFFGISLFMMLIALIFYLYTLCQHINRYEWKNGCKISAATMITALILNCAGMACFHIAEDLETNDVTDNGDLKLAPYSMFFGSDMSADLIYRTTREYGWSYALSWCAVACELLSAVLFMVVSCCYVKSKTKTKVYKSQKQPTVVVTQPPPVYETERVVVAPQKVYLVEDNSSYYSSGRGTYDPYNHSQGSLMNGYSPNYSYDKGWVIQ